MTSAQSPGRAGATEWTLSLLVAVNLAWTTLFLGGFRPETMLVSWILTGSAWALQLLNSAFTAERIHPASWFPLPFLAYAAANVLWVSPVAWLGWRDWLGWLQMAGTFWIVINGLRHRGPRLLVLGSIGAIGLIAVILACYQRFLWPDFLMMGRTQAAQFFGRSSGPFGIPNSLAAFLLLLIPATAAFAWQRQASAVQRILAGYFAIVFLLGIELTISRGAWISLVIAVGFWPLCVRERSLEWRVGVSIGAFALALVAASGVYLAVPSVKDRFDRLVAEAGERSRPILWRASLELFGEAPIVGTGAGSYNTLFESHRPTGFHDEPLWAHNDYLNTLSDYGLVGFFLSFGGIAAIAYTAAAGKERSEQAGIFSHRVETPDITRALAIGLLAFGISLVVDFHLKIPALALLVSTIGGECVLRSWPFEPAGNQSGGKMLGYIFGAVVVALMTLGVALPLYRGETLRYDARYRIDQMARKNNPTTDEQRETLSEVDNELQEALALDPSNGQAWADRSYVSALWTRLAPGRAAELGQQADEAAHEALARSRVVPEFWIRQGVALDLQGCWADATPAFGHAVQLAPLNAIAWYYQAYHFSLTRSTHTLALASTRQALEIDPYFQPAIILQNSLNSSR